MGYFLTPEPLVIAELLPKGKRHRRWETEISIAAGELLAPCHLCLRPHRTGYVLEAAPVWPVDGIR